MLERYKWLEKATAKIRFGPDRRAVQRELEAHLDDAKECRTAAGLPEEEAEAAVLQAMGDPEAIAEELGRLHRPWWGYLWRASQIALAGALALYILLLGVWAERSNIWAFPGMYLYHYLTWEPYEVEDILEEREIPCTAQIRTGGYTIRAERAVLRKTSQTDPEWTLYLTLDITMSRWGEMLYVGSAVPSVRSSEGEVERYGALVEEAVWGFWQKSEMIVFGLSEDTEWLKLDFGSGVLRRTMRIDLKEAAA